MQKPAHDILGVPPDADEATIKKAYRRRSKEAHPDTGGSQEAFHQIQVAYKEMMGESDSPPINAPEIIAQVYAAMLEQLGEKLVYVDIHSEFKKHFNNNLARVDQEMHDIRKRIKLLKRISKNCKKESIITQINAAQIANCNATIKNGLRAIEELKACLVYVDSIDYTPEEMAQAQGPTYTVFGAGGFQGGFRPFG